MSGQPWDFQTAEAHFKAAEQEQRRVESEISVAFRQWARAQRVYAVALARRMFELKAGGMAITACETLAKGDPSIAALRQERDEAEGIKETAKAASWRVNADRKDINEFLNWSKRRDLAEAYGTGPEPEFSEPIGARQ